MTVSLLQLLHEEYDEVWIAEIQAKVDEAKASVERGEVLPLDAVMARLKDKFHKEALDIAYLRAIVYWARDLGATL